METAFLTSAQVEASFFQQKLIVYAPEVQVSMWEDEVSFYNRLLSWWLLGCEEEEQPAIEGMMAQLKGLTELELPLMKEKMKLVQSTAVRSNFRRWQQAKADLRDLFYFFDQSLNKLKLTFFQGKSQYGHVKIW
jgi:hypothetical protein